MKNKNIFTKTTINILQIIFIAFTFFAIDAILRMMSRWLGYYSIYKIPPSLFSLCWILIILSILSMFPRKAGKILYIIIYTVLAVYSVAQYIYYLIFNKFMFFSDLQYAREGGECISFVADVLSVKVIAMTIVLIVLGFLGVKFFPDFKIKNKMQTRSIRILCVCVGILGIIFIPNLYKIDNNQAMNAMVEYETFTSSGFDMEIAGYYQYLARDLYISYLKPKPDTIKLKNTVNEYLTVKEKHTSNQMTNFLKGKNVILVQMESIDDWIISKENTPTIYKMVQEGINFTNMYTPCYGSGWTFGTEFAFNSGVFQGSTIMSGARLARNSFPYALANIASSQGYITNSLHENTGNYYNRTSMHKVLGYTYHSSQDYLKSGENIEDDTTLINDDCWNIITNQKPFFSFLITFSAHLPYDSDNELSRYALEKYSEYDISTRDSEVNYLLAKARVTDDMFAVLLEQLDADGLLDNTVIIAYTDHYCYGLNDKQLIRELSEENGSSILERTPAFIWYKDCDSMVVDKVCQTIDWLPTIANFFGLNVSSYVMGNDIFDDAYDGYAIFPDDTWLTQDAYVINGVVSWNKGMSEEEIENMNSFVQKFYDANEAILASDYYTQFED